MNKTSNRNWIPIKCEFQNKCEVNLKKSQKDSYRQKIKCSPEDFFRVEVVSFIIVTDTKNIKNRFSNQKPM